MDRTSLIYSFQTKLQHTFAMIVRISKGFKYHKQCLD